MSGNMGAAAAKSAPAAYAFGNRSLEVQASIILDGKQTVPYSTLKTLGITEIGTDVWSNYQASWWTTLKSWNALMHQQGFKTRALIREYTARQTLIQQAVAAGFDGVALDEMIAAGQMTKTALQQTIQYARKLNPNVAITIDEGTAAALASAASWVSGIAGVRLASTDYNNFSTATGMQLLASKAGARSGVWVIFVPDSQYNWSCYSNLSSWLTSAKAANMDILLWETDGAGAWQQNWPTVTANLS